ARRAPPIRDARPRGRAGGAFVVDDPAQARGLPAGVRRLRRRAGGELRPSRTGAAHGGPEDRAQPAEDRVRDRKRPDDGRVRRPGRAAVVVRRRDADPQLLAYARTDPGGGGRVARDVEGAEAAWLPVCRPDDLLRADAGLRPGRRPHGRLLPLRGGVGGRLGVALVVGDSAGETLAADVPTG